jgi:hypothetical protein
VTLDGPTAPIVGDHRSEPATLRPKSPVPNPGVAVDMRITLTPAKGVDGPSVSPTAHWLVAAVAGGPFTANIRSDAGAVDATLDLLKAPVARATPPATRRITITDHREANLIANWAPEITFDKGGNPATFTSVEIVQHRNGIHNFKLGAVLTPPLTNPGLTVSGHGAREARPRRLRRAGRGASPRRSGSHRACGGRPERARRAGAPRSPELRFPAAGRDRSGPQHEADPNRGAPVDRVHASGGGGGGRGRSLLA